MRLNPLFLGLPASIVVLVLCPVFPAQSTAGQQQTPNQWPWNLPKHVKYWPEDPPYHRRDLAALEENARQGKSPVGVLKMSADEGEKFFMEYWQYEAEQEQTSLLETAAGLRRREEPDWFAGNLLEADFRAPFALHIRSECESTSERKLRIRAAVGIRDEAAAALAILEKKAYLCPTGTSSCSAIGYPNSCCTTEETCFVIQDTGLGPVGCCPNGSTCGGSVSTCNSSNTPCADNLGGGCCIPNYVCDQVGCVINPSIGVTTTIATQTSSLSSLESTHTTTVVSTLTSATTTSTSTSTSTTACAATYTACPAALGGGCCPTDRVCASSSCILPTTSTTTVISTTSPGTSSATGVAPVRPTSATITSTSTQTSATDTSCPTGFYACEAYYAGGCCRTGRNCDTTSCPVVSSSTILSSGVTVIVPAGAAATTTSPTGTCATGWSSCAASLGGDCCPTGFDCGTASCSSVNSVATVTEVIQKASPSSGDLVARGMIRGWHFIAWGFILVLIS